MTGTILPSVHCPVVVIGAIVVALATPTWALAQGGVGTSSGSSSTASTVANSPGPNSPTPLPVGTGAISGTVVDASTGAPLVGARVSLGWSNIGPVTRVGVEMTDSRGRFGLRKHAIWLRFRST